MLGLLAPACGGVKGPLITTFLGEQHAQSSTLHGIVGNNYRAAAVCSWGSADGWQLAERGGSLYYLASGAALLIGGLWVWRGNPASY